MFKSNRNLESLHISKREAEKGIGEFEKCKKIYEIMVLYFTNLTSHKISFYNVVKPFLCWEISLQIKDIIEKYSQHHSYLNKC